MITTFRKIQLSPYGLNLHESSRVIRNYLALTNASERIIEWWVEIAFYLCCSII